MVCINSRFLAVLGIRDAPDFQFKTSYKEFFISMATQKMTPKKTATRSRKSTKPPPELTSALPVALGMRITAISRKKVIAEMPVKAIHLTRGGYVHGGAVMAFGDAVGAAGTINSLAPGYRTVTMESKTNFFAAAMPPMLTAVSIALHLGRSTHVWQTTIRNADGSRAAIVTQTQIVLAPRPEQAKN